MRAAPNVLRLRRFSIEACPEMTVMPPFKLGRSASPKSCLCELSRKSGTEFRQAAGVADAIQQTMRKLVSSTNRNVSTRQMSTAHPLGIRTCYGCAAEAGLPLNDRVSPVATVRRSSGVLATPP
jgi:hypothetical protein